MSKRVFISGLILAGLAVGTYIAIQFAQGYRVDLKEKGVKETGLLVADSDPEGASVFIDGKLTTATDDTLNLPPAEYQVEIKKDGYHPWQKNLKVEKGLVTQSSARLFPAVPNLTALTFVGAKNPTPSPDGQKIAFVVDNATTEDKNGLYILNLLDRPLNFRSEPVQIARDLINFSFDQALLTWSPDSGSLIASKNGQNLMVSASGFNQPADIRDVSARLPVVLNEWQETLDTKNQERLKLLPVEMQQVATQSAKHVYWSPDEEMILYTATASAKISEPLITPLPASSNQPQDRQIEPGKIYVYDLKEDKNFYIKDELKTEEAKEDKEPENISKLKAFASQYSPMLVQKVQWFPSSRHLIKTNEDKVTVLEYDGMNETTIYAGPFAQDFVYPWPNGSKLVILTALGQQDSDLNLYAINLR